MVDGHYGMVVDGVTMTGILKTAVMLFYALGKPLALTRLNWTRLMWRMLIAKTLMKCRRTVLL